MKDESKTKAELIKELVKLRRHINKLERSETEGRKKEERYNTFKKFVEESREGMGWAGLDSSVRYMNPALLNMVAEESTEDVYGKTVLTYYSEETQQRLDEEIFPTILSEGEWTGEMLLHTAKGTAIPTLNSLFALRDEEGNTVSFANVVTDLRELKKAEEELKKARDVLEKRVQERTTELAKINNQLNLELTERKQAEEKIKQQNELLVNLFESLSHPFYVIDAEDYTVKKANSASRFGTLSETSICYALTHKADKPCEGPVHCCPLEEVKETKRHAVVEHVHYDKNGDKRTVEVHGYPILDAEGNVIQMIEYIFDITERKLVEEALKENEEKYRTLFETSPQGIAVSSLDGRLLEFNPAFQNMVGYTQKELNELNFLSLTPEKWHKAELESIDGIMDKGSGTFEKEYIRKSGTVFPVVLSGWIIRDKERKPVKVGAYIEDITERKRIEQMKDTLLRDVSHELKHPVAIAKMELEVLKRKIRGQQNLSEYVEALEENIDRLQTDVHRIMDFSQYEAPEEAFKMSPVSFISVLNEISEEFIIHCRVKEVELVVQADPHLPEVLGNYDQLRRLLQNLLENALKFTSLGGKIEISAQLINGSLDVRVQDTGRGISRDNLEMVFERFFKEHGSVPGVGLGLTICRDVVDNHGGVIWVESEGEGKGATVIFTLPIA